MKLTTTMVSLALAVVLVDSPVNAQQLHTAFIDPSGGFTQVVSVSDHGVKMIYVSGQVGTGDDFSAHVESAFSGVVSRLESAGASTADLIKLTIYLSNYQPGNASVLAIARQNNGFNQNNLPATTLIGVESLYSDAALIEIEGEAVVAGK